ncbi:hypothetical protein ACM0IS_00370 [Mycoplasma aquilae ATCC BAA-1896]|uniref:hypothetical protein n=1 Tax=Mycoplasma aquilae TaxID=1312741 RepID=UPI003A8AE5BC
MKNNFKRQLEKTKTYLIIVIIAWFLSIIFAVSSYSISTLMVMKTATNDASVISTGMIIAQSILSIFSFVSSIIGIVFGIKLAVLSNDVRKLFTKMVYETSFRRQIEQANLVKLLAYSRTIERLFIFNLIGILSGPVLLIINLFFTRNALMSSKNVLDLIDDEPEQQVSDTTEVVSN